MQEKLQVSQVICGGCIFVNGVIVAVSDRIRALIDARGLRQATVANRPGEPEYWLSKRLTGRTSIKADELPRLADALNVDPCELLDRLPEATGADRMAADFTRGLGELRPTAREMRMALAIIRLLQSWRDEED
jgi:transcriptional regulator with XRE-family HTH domain